MIGMERCYTLQRYYHDNISYMIELRDVSFSYDNKPLLHNVNITIGQGDYWGVVGLNGSGKSTMIKIILGLLKPQEGEVIYSRDGKVVTSLTMGYVPQCSQIDRMFPITVYEAVELGLISATSFGGLSSDKSHRMLIYDAMERVGISSLAHRPVGSLSGGELQRTLMARAVVSNPDLLVFDEPETYLDYESEETLYSLIKEYNRECTVILVTHDKERIFANATHMAALSAGSVECRII